MNGNLRHLTPTNALEKGNFFVETVAKFGVIYIMLHFRSGMCKYTPCKINMVHLQITHLERKMIWNKPPWGHVPAVHLQGCTFHLNLSIRMPTLTTPTPSPRFFSSKLTNPQEKKWVSRRRVATNPAAFGCHHVTWFYVKFRRKHPKHLTICYQQLPCLKLSYLFQPIILGIHVSFQRCSTVCLLSWLSPCFSILGGYGSSFAIPTNLWFLLP